MKVSTLTLTPTLFSLSLLPASILGQPTPTNRPFTVIAAHSASPIHLQSVQASGRHFFIANGGPSTYCPVPPLQPQECPPGNSTVFVSNGGGASLAVAVPGGQQIYVAADGALSYTGPHSASIPAGADLGSFTYSPPDPTSSNNLGYFSFTGLGATGFVACPVGTDAAGPPWQVFANVQGGDWEKCIGFNALTSDYTGGEVGAWEYT